MKFGWDISTAIVGIAVFDDSGAFVRFDHIDLRRLEGLNQKADCVEKFVVGLIKDYGPGPHEHYVEDRLSGFSGGGSNSRTIMTLVAFNAIVSWILSKTGSVEHIHPSTVKSIMTRFGLLVPKGADKKELTLSFVRKTLPDVSFDMNKNGNPQPWCYDRADAYVTAFASMRKVKNADDRKDRGTERVLRTGRKRKT